MPEIVKYSQFDFHDDIRNLTDQIANDCFWEPSKIVGLGRGGLIPATCLSHRLQVPMFALNWSSRDYDMRGPGLGVVADYLLNNHNILFVDDMVDSGNALSDLFTELDSYCSLEAKLVTDQCRVAVLINNIAVDKLFENETGAIRANYWARDIDRREDNRWVEYFWEQTGKL